MAASVGGDRWGIDSCGREQLQVTVMVVTKAHKSWVTKNQSQKLTKAESLRTSSLANGGRL